MDLLCAGGSEGAARARRAAKFGCSPEAAKDRIEGLGPGSRRSIDERWAWYLARPARCRGRCDSLADLLGPSHHFVLARVVLVLHLLEDRQEPLPCTPVAVPRRKVGAAEEWLPVRRQEHGHRPAAPAGEHSYRFHVDVVDVGALLSIDLDGDVVFVDVPRDLHVLEGLALHDMAPVTRGVTYRQKHRLSVTPCPVEGLISPRVPIDRIVGVLKQVRARLEDQPVHELRRAVVVEVVRSRFVVRSFGGQRSVEALHECRRAITHARQCRVGGAIPSPGSLHGACFLCRASRMARAGRHGDQQRRENCDARVSLGLRIHAMASWVGNAHSSVSPPVPLAGGPNISGST